MGIIWLVEQQRDVSLGTRGKKEASNVSKWIVHRHAIRAVHFADTRNAFKCILHGKEKKKPHTQNQQKTIQTKLLSWTDN